ncbi:hypothetical protein V7S57_02205 [Caulobacter sp. CCNWLY153]|uniref:hypothetical protein n=1 Tax=unclassified Caulobacter TaxID=2648921 RepID=UPI002FF2C71E
MVKHDAEAATSRAKRDARRWIAGHECNERVSRSFDFRTPGMGSAYAFSITWTPGSIALAGDVGEITLTNHSLGNLVGALSWAATSDTSYLLEKTDRRKVYDPQQTAADIIGFANESALWEEGDRLKDHRRWLRERPDPYAWVEPWTNGEYHWWDQAPGEWEMWAEDRPAPRAFTKERASRKDFWSGRALEMEVVEPPRGWWIWHRLREEIAPELPNEAIFRSRHRRRIARGLLTHLKQARPDQAAELCSNLRLDDYYGATRWDPRSLGQVECIRYGAWLALIHLEPERAYTWRPPGWNELSDAFPETHRALEARRAEEAKAWRASKLQKAAA